MKENGKRVKWLDKDQKYIKMEIDMLAKLIIMSLMVLEFGTILKNKLKDKVNGKMEKELLG